MNLKKSIGGLFQLVADWGDGSYSPTVMLVDGDGRAVGYGIGAVGLPVSSAPRSYVSVTIAGGQSLSPAVDLGNGTLVGIYVPSAWDAAALTFMTSSDGINFVPVYDDAVERIIATGSMPTAQAREIGQQMGDWIGKRWLKLRSGTMAIPVPQYAPRTFVLAVAN